MRIAAIRGLVSLVLLGVAGDCAYAQTEASSTILQAVLRPSNGTRLSFEVSRIVVFAAARTVTVTTSCSSSV